MVLLKLIKKHKLQFHNYIKVDVPCFRHKVLI